MDEDNNVHSPKRNIVRVPSGCLARYNRFKNSVFQDSEMEGINPQPSEEKEYSRFMVEGQRCLFQNLTFGKETLNSGLEYLELFASLNSLDSIEIQIKLNHFLAKMTRSEIAYLILPSEDKLAFRIDVIWNVPLHEDASFKLDSSCLSKMNYLRKSLLTANVKDQHRHFVKLESRVVIKTCIVIPVFLSPNAEKALFLISFVNKHLPMPNSNRITIESLKDKSKGSNFNTVCEYTKDDECNVHDSMQYLLLILEHLVCDTSMGKIAEGINKGFKLCKELIVLKDKSNEILEAFMLKSQEIIDAERCAIFFSCNGVLNGHFFYRFCSKRLIRTVKVPTDFSICGFVYANKELVNGAVDELPDFCNTFDKINNLKTTHILSIPIKINKNEVIAIMEFYNKTDSPIGFDEVDESIASFLAKICLFCLKLNID